MERVKQELSEAGLLPEEWGGETAVVAVRPCFESPECLLPWAGVWILANRK